MRVASDQPCSRGLRTKSPRENWVTLLAIDFFPCFCVFNDESHARRRRDGTAILSIEYKSPAASVRKKASPGRTSVPYRQNHTFAHAVAVARHQACRTSISACPHDRRIEATGRVCLPSKKRAPGIPAGRNRKKKIKNALTSIPGLDHLQKSTA